jgi:hypothetical protein
MARLYPSLISLARRLRPDPERFAAAAALQDPSVLTANTRSQAR